jgi:cytoskeleton protein RodZ
MSDEQDKSAEKNSAAEGPKCGERLAEARREQKISVLEVAKELHLDEPKVRALECNDFNLLGAPVFAKGHLRKYAQLVGVDEADIFADYYAMTRSSATPPLIVGSHRIRQEFSPGPWIAVIAVLLVAGGGYWWFFMRDAGPSPPVIPDASQPEGLQPGQLQPEEMRPEGLQPDQLQPEEMQPEQSQPDTTTGDIKTATDEIVLAAAAPNEKPPVAAAETSPLAAGQVDLAIDFTGDCWTEISDADGRQLYVSMGHGGQSIDVSGKAPLSVLFGNVDNVSLRVDGNDYTLPAANSANRMVRVAIVSQ